jgi:hypothetical protein
LQTHRFTMPAKTNFVYVGIAGALLQARNDVLQSNGVILRGRCTSKNIGKYTKQHGWSPDAVDSLFQSIKVKTTPLYKDAGARMEHILNDRGDLLFKILVQGGIRAQGSAPGSRTQMLKDVQRLNANIFDVLDCCETEDFSNLRFFDTMKDLRRYSVAEGKIFPREYAKELSLRYLLKPFFA